MKSQLDPCHFIKEKKLDNHKLYFKLADFYFILFLEEADFKLDLIISIILFSQNVRKF